MITPLAVLIIGASLIGMTGFMVIIMMICIAMRGATLTLRGLLAWPFVFIPGTGITLTVASFLM